MKHSETSHGKSNLSYFVSKKSLIREKTLMSAKEFNHTIRQLGLVVNDTYQKCLNVFIVIVSQTCLIN